MIPTNNQFLISNESQSMQVPKIDHILAHASNPELSYIYARPELQASAAVNNQDVTSLSRTDSQTPKKGRPAKEKKNLDGTDKKGVVKPRKPDPYDKYYLDNTKPAKKAPPKKVDLWSQEAWEDILNRKRKYFEFLKLTGELNDERSDDDGGQEEDFGDGFHEQHHGGEYEQNFEVEDEEDEGEGEAEGEGEGNIHHGRDEAENEENEENNNIDSQNQIEIEEEGEGLEQGEPEGGHQFSDKIETSERSENGDGGQIEEEQPEPEAEQE